MTDTVAVAVDDYYHLARRCLAATASAVAGSEAYLVPVTDAPRRPRSHRSTGYRPPERSAAVDAALIADPSRSNGSIAQEHGMSTVSVSYRRKRLGFAPSAFRGRQLKVTDEELTALNAAGIGYVEIARRKGMHATGVWRRLHRLGLKVTP